jgi:hypothetical protein
MQSRRNRMFSLYSYIFICVLIVAASAGCGGNSAERISSHPPVLEGTWEMIHFGRAPYGPFGGTGSLEMDASGDITGGSITNFGVDIQQFTGGALLVTPEGNVTGTMDAFLGDSGTKEKQTIHSGQMLFNKDMIVYAASLDLARNGVGILLKEAGTYTSADLEGTWVFPLEGVVSISLNGEGRMTGCTYQPAAGEAVQCLGEISVAPEGSISGNIGFTDKKFFSTTFSGYINPEKNSMILAGGLSIRFEGMATLAVKQDKGVSLSDGKGKWKVFLSIYDDVLYGTIDVDDSGTIAGGEWATAKKSSGTFTGGTILLKEQGDVSGFISTSTGNTYTITGGSMISSGNLISLSVADKAGRHEILILARTLPSQ